MDGNDSLRSDDPHAMPGSTHLWGTWELSCDLPPNNLTDATARASHPPASGNWLNQVKHVGVFDNAEAFWGLWQCILLPSQLPVNTSYFLFRSFIVPMWEHEANRRGGKWVLTFSHPPLNLPADEDESREGKPSAAKMLPVDGAWQKLCLAAIGELFPCEEEEICGITVSRGKARGVGNNSEWKLCVWTRTANAEDTQMAIAQFIKNIVVNNVVDGSVCTPLTQITPNILFQYGNSYGGGEKGGSARMTLNFMSHRELMEAKQSHAQGGTRSLIFKPKYTLDL
ncbi:unnamed protein product [Phytomonas sp. Hart1]|nr:unnamed protein product [Phytomonas sp. Hart1]|eukprot:CCW71865.1 unnamed protein product [Phytomonas sp. isolate Hart1]